MRAVRTRSALFNLYRAIGALFLHHAGRNEEARAQLEKTFELDPNFWIAHLTLGKVYTQQRKYPEAMAEFAKARELSRRKLGSDCFDRLRYAG